MIYAQILSGAIQNIITLDDSTLVAAFTIGYDFCIEIDQLSPIPQIGWTYDGTNFTAPTPPTPPPPLPLNQQYTEAQYGQLLINQFTELNVSRSLTGTQLFSLASNLSPFYILLQCGSLQAFLDNISSIPVDGVMITSAIITQFQTAIQAYLAGD